MPNDNTCTLIKAVPIRDAIKQVLHWAHVAKETRNRDLYLTCKQWLRDNIRYRHTDKLWLFK